MDTFIINLDRRPDKWAYIRKELERVALGGVTRFTAFDIKPGWKGCRDSHLALLEKCKDHSLFTILEDDVLFLQDPHEIVPLALSELPDDWDCLFLGASPQEPFERYSPHLFKMGKAWTTHAIIWHPRPNGAVEYILKNKDEIGKIDVFFTSEVFPRFNCFLTYPLVATQTQFDSDTCTRSDVSTIEENYNLHCK
jgi:GR25 family glycosyltransferase involved in LPS biosynthesis